MPHSASSSTCTRSAVFLAAVFGLISVAGAEGAPQEPASAVQRIDVDFSAPVGTIRPLFGVNCGPYAANFTIDLSDQFRELKIPLVRPIAPNYPGQDCVHIQYIFRNMDADADDPANYDFELTDRYIGAIMAVGAKPIYNLGLGVDIYLVEEAKSGYKKAKSNRMPADSAKFAKICANIVRHYNQGWASGFHYNIEYWEIWNEPNLKSFWLGTQEEYLEFYSVVSKVLKELDPALKVGGPAFSGGSDLATFRWLEDFLASCQKRNLPLDFCSWHSYGADHVMPLKQIAEVHRLLLKYGYPKTENQLDEWAPAFRSFNDWFYDPVEMGKQFERIGSAEGGSFDVAFLTFLQDTTITGAAYYAGDTLGFGFADRYGARRPIFYAFKAFSQMLETPARVKASGSDIEKGVSVLAGLSADKKHANILVSNYRGDLSKVEIHVSGLPWTSETTVTRQVVDQTHSLDTVATDLFLHDALVIASPSPRSTVSLFSLVPGNTPSGK
ncbi:MAG: hypothetical protein JWM88_1699 [Verrucomicrobia bacterium]|nr:hypothetical protein [Verrucomicrobiota bacterium]